LPKNTADGKESVKKDLWDSSSSEDIELEREDEQSEDPSEES
jgi:hypothetical protein